MDNSRKTRVLQPISYKLTLRPIKTICQLLVNCPHVDLMPLKAVHFFERYVYMCGRCTLESEIVSVLGN